MEEKRYVHARVVDGVEASDDAVERQALPHHASVGEARHQVGHHDSRHAETTIAPIMSDGLILILLVDLGLLFRCGLRLHKFVKEKVCVS